MIGAVFYWCLVFVGAIGVLTGRGLRSTLTLPARIAFLFFLALCPFLFMAAYALLGAFDEIRPTLWSTIRIFVLTPLLSAFAILGMYVSWALVYSWLVSGYDRIYARYCRRQIPEDWGLRRLHGSATKSALDQTLLEHDVDGEPSDAHESPS